MKGPAFLRSTVATKDVSPASYRKQEAFNKLTESKARPLISKSVIPRTYDKLVKKSKQTPGAGHYDLKSIDKGFAATTLGASRGWK